jgi:hypothetical protein
LQDTTQSQKNGYANRESTQSGAQKQKQKE